MANKNSALHQLHYKIYNDPIISDPSKIYLTAEKRGPLLRKHICIIIEGGVASKIEKQQVEKIASEEITNFEVENNLKVLR